MKCVFVGPSLFGANWSRDGIDVRPPAAQGDILRAVFDGAAAIGLIDGCYEAVASVWHKELLFALSEGVHVVGGASMGALRAAECAAFGMEPIGQIARAYIDGTVDDDAWVAVTHGPWEVGSPPLTEALVDAEASIGKMEKMGVVTSGQASRLISAARSMFFKERTIQRLVRTVFPTGTGAAVNAYKKHKIYIKRSDALAVIERLKTLPERRKSPPANWTLSQPATWRRAVKAASQIA